MSLNYPIPVAPDNPYNISDNAKEYYPLIILLIPNTSPQIAPIIGTCFNEYLVKDYFIIFSIISFFYSVFVILVKLSLLMLFHPKFL